MEEKLMAFAQLLFGGYWRLGLGGLALLISALAAARLRRPPEVETKKPRSFAPLAFVAVAAAAFLAGWRHGPVRELQVPVRVVVRDDVEISRLKRLLAATSGENEGVVKEALATGEELKAALSRAVEAEGRLAAALNRCAALEAEVADLKPKAPADTPEVRRARALIASIDRAHMAEAVGFFDKDEVTFKKGTPGSDGDPPRLEIPDEYIHKLADRALRKHTWNPADRGVRYGERSVVTVTPERPYIVYPVAVSQGRDETGLTPYHLGCDVCQRNLIANLELDELFEANPELSRIDWALKPGGRR